LGVATNDGAAVTVRVTGTVTGDPPVGVSLIEAVYTPAARPDTALTLSPLGVVSVTPLAFGKPPAVKTSQLPGEDCVDVIEYGIAKLGPAALVI
jgi:hypothetical protein